MRGRRGISPHRIHPPIKDTGAAAAVQDLLRRVNQAETNNMLVGAGSIDGTDVGQIDGTNNIIANTITTGSIHAGAITATTIAAGAISAYVISGQSITLATNIANSNKVLLDTTGIRAYDVGGVIPTLTIASADGSITATKGTITGAVIQTGGSIAGAAGSNKVMMDYQGIKAFDTFGNVSVSIDTNGVLTVARGSITLSSTVPAGTAPRVVLDSTGIKGYPSGSTPTFILDATTGLITATGIITAQSGSNLPTAYVTGYMPGSANRYSNSAFQKGDNTLDTAGWTVVSATASDGGTTVPPVYGARTLKLVAASTSNVSLQPSTVVDQYKVVLPGVSYTFSHYVWPATNARQTRVDINWYNAAGTLLSTTPGTALTTAASQWNRPSTTGQAPANAAYGIGVHYIALAPAASDVFYTECFQMEEGDRVSAWAPRPDEVLVNQITAVNINVANLQSISAAMGTLTSGTIISATIQTQVSPSANGGVQLDNTGLYGYPTGGGSPLFSLTGSGLTATSATISGSITATGGAISGTLTLSGTLQSSAAAVTKTVVNNTGVFVTDTDGSTKLVFMQGGSTVGIQFAQGTGDTTGQANRLRWMRDRADSGILNAYIGSHYLTGVSSNFTYLRMAVNTANGGVERAYIDIQGGITGNDSDNRVDATAVASGGVTAHTVSVIRGDGSSSFLQFAPDTWGVWMKSQINWAHVTVSGTTYSISGTGNGVSAVNRGATAGLVTIVWDTAFNTTDYGFSVNVFGGWASVISGTQTTAHVQVQLFNNSGVAADLGFVVMSVGQMP